MDDDGLGTEGVAITTLSVMAKFSGQVWLDDSKLLFLWLFRSCAFLHNVYGTRFRLDLQQLTHELKTSAVGFLI